jgi:hypothetical protein
MLMVVSRVVSIEIDDGFSAVVFQCVVYLNLWSWILAVISHAAAYLNRPNAVLSYMNAAILPWYILHQTITIVVASKAAPLELDVGIEFLLVTLSTFAGCAIGYELARRWTVTRFLFGLKQTA